MYISEIDHRFLFWYGFDLVLVAKTKRSVLGFYIGHLLSMIWNSFQPYLLLPWHIGFVSGFGRVQPNSPLSRSVSCSFLGLLQCTWDARRTCSALSHVHLKVLGSEKLTRVGLPLTSSGPWPRHSGEPMHPPFFPQADSPEMKLIGPLRRSQSPLVVSSTMHPCKNFPPSLFQPSVLHFCFWGSHSK